MSDYHQAYWREALETLGEEAIRYQLVNRLPILDETGVNVPYGFANAWMAEQAAERVAERRRTESRRYLAVLTFAFIGAVSGIIGALPVVASWVR